MTPDTLYPLENRSIVCLSGPDRATFLQNLISNDVGLCASGQAIFAALLTPQGKFLHDLFIVETGEDYLIDCETARADDLVKRLKAYALRAKITLENARDKYDLAAATGSVPALKHIKAYRDPRLPELGWRIIFEKNLPEKPHYSDFSFYDHHRLMLGVGDGSRDMVIEKSTLSEGNFDLLNGISWIKGCYVGQELTARMHYRTLAKKRLFPVMIEGPAPEMGSRITLNEEDVGEMRSSREQNGLALLSIERADQSRQLNIALLCGDAKLTPSKPTWMEKEI